MTSYHPRHCHHHKEHHHRKNIAMNLWTQKNSIQVYEFAPFKKIGSRTNSTDSTGSASDIYFGKPKYEEKKEEKEEGLIKHEKFSDLVERLKKTAASKHWERAQIKHHVGICVPVFSLKSDKNGSCGVGEYLDLLPLIDWCNSIGFDVIQLLPINDTNPFDNSPFSPISSFSLNPKLLSLRQLPNFDKQTEEMKSIINELSALNKAETVQWQKVIELKRKWLWDYFCLEESQQILESPEYKDFIEKNKSWLEGYGLFCTLKNVNEWRHWEEWKETKLLPEDFDSDKQSILELDCFKEFLNEHRKEVQFNMFSQYLSFQQMFKVKSYAESKNVLIKGDVPFLVSYDSVDVWLNRSLFNLEKTAGAPPDMFAEDGQNWGVPIYRWNKIRETDFKWWKARLATANSLYHLFRIDHVVGFFRVWAIPKGEKGSMGEFEPSEPEEFVKQGEEIMKMLLENCDMLPIGEDLGTVPMSVRETLQRLGICGTKVMRWERLWEEDDKPFINFQDYNADSMTTLSTHDSETLGQWWKNQPEEVEAYCRDTGLMYAEENLSTELREKILTHSIQTPSLFHIHLLQEWLALEPSLVHSDTMLERINLPGQVLESNWSYRLLPTIETISENTKLRDMLTKLVALKDQNTTQTPQEKTVS